MRLHHARRVIGAEKPHCPVAQTDDNRIPGGDRTGHRCVAGTVCAPLFKLGPDRTIGYRLDDWYPR